MITKLPTSQQPQQIVSQSQPTETRLGTRLALFYRKLRRPLAFILIFLALLPQVLPFEGLQIASLVALGIIVVELLFEIQENVTLHRQQSVFPEFYDASVAMKQTIARYMQSGNPVHVRALGMSMGHAWAFLVNTISPFQENNASSPFVLEIAMLDPQWAELRKINADWARRSKSNSEEIEHYINLNQQQLQAKGWKINLFKYRHLPNWHGIVINDELLFLSTCYWKNGKLIGGENLYELYDARNSALEKQRIVQFVSWFEYIKSATGANP